MKKLQLECWTRNRLNTITVLLTSLLGQTFQDWDITILEEADCSYLSDPFFNNLIRRVKNHGHQVTWLHPRSMLGCVKSAQAVMRETETKYAMKLDDDHLFEPDALEKLMTALEEDQNIGSIGGMLYNVARELIPISKIPSDFNKWTGTDHKLWNDYSTLSWEFPEQVVDVDFVRAPFIYRADLLRETDFIEEYTELGYSPLAFRIESEIANTINSKFDTRTCLHTGSYMWHCVIKQGGWRMMKASNELLQKDGEVYYNRWYDLHKLGGKST